MRSGRFKISLLLISVAVFVFVNPILPIPIVRAQTTSITNVTYPKQATFDLERRTTDPPLLLQASVAYSDAKPGFYLSVGVFDLESGNILSASGSASGGSCDSEYARCLTKLTSNSGVQYVKFLLAGYKPTMSMSLVVILVDDAKNMIYSSESDYEFVITMTATLALSVIVPGSVLVTLDGVEQAKGNLELNLVPGNHSISVPEIVQLDNATRLRFQRWSDDNEQASRSISLSRGTVLTGVYVTQYWLEASSSHGNSTGSGWYDDGTKANFSVSSTTVPMDGVLGLIGGKWTLDGWYEKDQLLTRSGNGTITMLGAHLLSARWIPDYTLPLLLLSGVALLLVVALAKRGFFPVIREKRGRRRKS